MRIRLTTHEARVIGALIEKEITTPAQYPLSLNALTAACNQKSSRDPVMQLSESEVQQIVDGLVKKHLVSDRGGFGSRVPKYQHRFANVGFGSLEFSEQEIAVICLLLLRGPQTAGELRSHSGRLCQFSDANETETVLQGLIARSDGPFVVQSAREPGRREARFAHLFGDEEIDAVSTVTTEATEKTADTGSGDRITQLEDLVLGLQEDLEAVKARLEALERKSMPED